MFNVITLDEKQYKRTEATMQEPGELNIGGPSVPSNEEAVGSVFARQQLLHVGRCRGGPAALELGNRSRIHVGTPGVGEGRGLEVRRPRSARLRLKSCEHLQIEQVG